MKALKGLFIYILVLAGIAVMAGIFLFATMYAFGYRIFGYGVIGRFSGQEIVSLYTPQLDTTDVQIVVNAKHFDVKVVQGKAFEVRYQDHAIGIYKGEGNAYIKGYSYQEENTTSEGNTNIVTKNTYSPLYYDAQDMLIEYQADKTAFENDIKSNATKMVIDLVEPEGYIWYKDCVLTITIPQDKTYDVVINGGEGNITLDSAIFYGLLEMNTTSGNVSLVGEQTNKTLERLTMSTADGRLDFSPIDNLYIGANGELGTLEITNSQDGKFSFGNLYASIQVKASGVKFQANHVLTGKAGFYYDCQEGSLNIQSLDSIQDVEGYTLSNQAQKTYMNSISAENATVKIQDIKGDVFVATTTGDVTLGNVYGATVDGHLTGVASITTTNGNITIGAIKENCILSSTYGNIQVSYYKGIKAYSRFGNIQVDNNSNENNTFVGYSTTEGKGYLVESLGYTTILRTSDGDITAKDILTPCVIEAENTGNVNVNFLPLYASNADGTTIMNTTDIKYYVESNKGNIDVTILGQTNTSSFVLEIGVANNKAYGSIGETNAIEYVGGSKQVLPTTAQVDGTDTNFYGPRMYCVSSSGSVTLHTQF